MVWQLQETWALQVEFSSSILPIAWRHTTIFASFTANLMHSHMVTSYRFFWAPIALHGLVHFLNTTGPSLTKVVYAHFDQFISIVYIVCSGDMWKCWWFHQLCYEFHGLRTNAKWCIWRQIWSSSHSTVRGDQRRSSKSSVLASGGRWGFNSSPQRFEQERSAIFIDIQRSLEISFSLGPIERQHVPNKSITNPMSCGKRWQDDTNWLFELEHSIKLRTRGQQYRIFISAKVRAWNLAIICHHFSQTLLKRAMIECQRRLCDTTHHSVAGPELIKEYQTHLLRRCHWSTIFWALAVCNLLQFSHQ